jgi:hypothetical protein
MKKILLSTSLVVLATTLTGCGKRLPQVYNVNRHVMPFEVANLTDAQREERLRLAAGKNGWSCQKVDAKKLICRLRARDHSATIDIDHNKHYFSINHVESSNLRYKNAKIHPTYNRWIKKLEQVIEKNLGLVKIETEKSTPTTNSKVYRTESKTYRTESKTYSTEPIAPTSVKEKPLEDNGNVDHVELDW